MRSNPGFDLVARRYRANVENKRKRSVHHTFVPECLICTTRLFYLMTIVLFLAGCYGGESSFVPSPNEMEHIQEASVPISETSRSDILPTSTALPTPLPDGSRKLTLCAKNGLYPGYIYFNWWWSQREFLQAVAPAPIQLGDDYHYYPTILEKIPSLADGDAAIQPVTVREGDRIVNSVGEVVELQNGVVYLPSGCQEDACAKTYTSGEVSMDQLVVDFQLLSDLKWSDGASLTANDSVFAYHVTKLQGFSDIGCASCGLPQGADPGAVERTAAYTAIDEHTVRWTGLPGYITPFYFLNFFSPMPKHLLEGMTPSDMDQFTSSLSGKNMVGWGPFMVTKWNRGKSLSLVRNPHYYRLQEGLPFLDEIEWIFINDETGLGLSGVLRGQCDVVSADATLRDILWDNGLAWYRGIQSGGGLQVVTIPRSWGGIAFNFAPPSNRPTFLMDASVRQAMLYGTNRKAIAEAVLGDPDLIANGFMPPQHPLFMKASSTLYLFSPERARELLAQAGWEDLNKDGILEKDGQPFIITLVTERSQPRAPGLAIFQMNMRDIGIVVKIEFVKPAALFDEDGTLTTRQFDLFWSIWPLQKQGYPFACAVFLTDSNTNIGAYSNLAFGTACRQALSSLDQQEAQAGHLLAQKIFNHDLPVLPLYLRPAVALARPEVTGLQLDHDGAITSFEQLDIQERQP